MDSVGDGKFNVGVSAIVRITLRNGSSHEDVGYGKIENCRSKADALDKCKKEAVTDALKRTLRTFGNLMGNCLYDKSYLNNIKTMQAQKEKFLPSRLYRPEHVSSTSRASTTTQAETKPSTDDLKPAVSRAPAPMLNNKPAQQTFTKITTKPAPQIISSKPLIASKPPQMAPKPAAQIVSKPAAPSRPVQAEVPKTTPPVAQKVTPADKRKFQEEGGQEEEGEEEDEESSTAEEQDETTSVEPLAGTLSDKYFELDEHDLAELENAESIDLMLCMSQLPDGGGSADESGLITDTSLQAQDDNSIISRPSRHPHHPQQSTTTKPVVKSTVMYPPQQTAKKPLLPPCIKTPLVKSAIRYPTVPISHLNNKPPVLVPTHPHHHLNRPVKKLRAGD